MRRTETTVSVEMVAGRCGIRPVVRMGRPRWAGGAGPCIRWQVVDVCRPERSLGSAAEFEFETEARDAATRFAPDMAGFWADEVR